MFGSMKLIDSSNAEYGVARVGNKPAVVTTPYLYAIAEGDVSGHLGIRKVGYNPDVNATMETLWPVGGEYVFPSSGMQMAVVSASTADTSTGTGVRSVELHYLDTGYVERTEVITMGGTTAVQTVSTGIWRVQNFHTHTAGTGGVAAGNVDIKHLSDTTVYGRIVAGINNSQSAIWTVPAGKTAYLTMWQAGLGSAKGNRFGEFRLRATANETEYNDGVFHIKDIVATQDACVVIPFTYPVVLPAKTDVKISVVSDASTAAAVCAGHFEGWYE